MRTLQVPIVAIDEGRTLLRHDGTAASRVSRIGQAPARSGCGGEASWLTAVRAPGRPSGTNSNCWLRDRTAFQPLCEQGVCRGWVAPLPI